MDIKSIIKQAQDAADIAGQQWMDEAVARGPRFLVGTGGLFGEPTEWTGTMLDNCGNAFLVFKDARSANYKRFLKENLIRNTYTKSIDIKHKWKRHQEHGLQVACMNAAKTVFIENGIEDIKMMDYID